MRINICLTVRDVNAHSYESAVFKAYAKCAEISDLWQWLTNIHMEDFAVFQGAARVAKEANGTYTVTIP